MNICEYFHVYKEIQSVSIRQGINIQEFAPLGFIYKGIYNINTCIFVEIYIYRKLLSMRTRKATTYVNLHTIRSYKNIFIIKNMYTSYEINIYKGILSNSNYKRSSGYQYIYIFVQFRFIYKNIYNIIHLYMRIRSIYGIANICIIILYNEF